MAVVPQNVRGLGMKGPLVSSGFFSGGGNPPRLMFSWVTSLNPRSLQVHVIVLLALDDDFWTVPVILSVVKHLFLDICQCREKGRFFRRWVYSRFLSPLRACPERSEGINWAEWCSQNDRKGRFPNINLKTIYFVLTNFSIYTILEVQKGRAFLPKYREVEKWPAKFLYAFIAGRSRWVHSLSKERLWFFFG